MNCPLILITDAQLGLSFLKTISILSLPQQPYLASIRAISNKSMANFISLGKKKETATYHPQRSGFAAYGIPLLLRVHSFPFS